MAGSRHGRRPGCQPARRNHSASLIGNPAGPRAPAVRAPEAPATITRRTLTMTYADKSTSPKIGAPGGPQAREAHGHHHRDVSGGWLRPAVFGAMDGLVTNVSLIPGGSGGSGPQTPTVLAGLPAPG